MKRVTISVDAATHAALLRISKVRSQPVATLVKTAVMHIVEEDDLDIAAFDERKDEPRIRYQAFVRKLIAHGRL